MRERILTVTGILVGGCLVLVAVLLIVLSVSEYKPVGMENLPIEEGGGSIYEGDQIEILTLNVGYAGLDKNMDFFMDGGKRNTPDSREKIEENLNGIISLLKEQSYDALLLQEVDRNSKRSYYINEAEAFQSALGGTSVFAQNFRCLFIPYPIPDFIGQVDSGLQTLTRFHVREAARTPLETSFSWPVRICQLKRCLLVSRIPVAESGRELVLINVHMDAYDDGSGREAQTRVLAKLMQEEFARGNYVIAGGDFNQVFPDDDFSVYPIQDSDFYEPDRLEKDIIPEEWKFAYDLNVPSCRLLNEPYDELNPKTQYYVIDGFIASPNVKLERVETIDAGFEYADHNPVKLTASLLE